MMSASIRMVTGSLTGRYIAPLTPRRSCTNVNSGMSEVSIRSSGMEARYCNCFCRALAVNFFINPSLFPGGASCRDDSENLFTVFMTCRMHDQYHRQRLHTTDRPVPLPHSIFGIGNGQAEGVRKCLRCELKRYPALPEVLAVLDIIPFEAHVPPLGLSLTLFYTIVNTYM